MHTRTNGARAVLLNLDGNFVYKNALVSHEIGGGAGGVSKALVMDKGMKVYIYHALKCDRCINLRMRTSS